MDESDRLLQAYQRIDHRLNPESVLGVADEEYPILSEVEDIDDRYEIIEEIARGGQKQICAAHDKVADRRVALATLHGSATAAESEAFLREARLHAALVHPNVTRVYDLGILPDNRAFFTMTLMTGGTLADQIADNTPLPELLEIFVRICDGMAYAHSRHVLHLDLKPENIQVGAFSGVFISDWGLAKIGEQRTGEGVSELGTTLDADLLNHFTLSGTVKGTPGYMAPEQARGDPTTVATDVYGLGAVLYGILTGSPVYEGANTRQVLKETVGGNLLRPTERVPSRDVPDALDAVCMRALATRPQDRYASVDALRKEILRYRDGFATQAESASLLHQLRLLVRRNQTAFSLITIFVAAIMMLTAVFIQRLSRSEQEAVAARDSAILARDAAEAAKEESTVALRALQGAQNEKKELSKMFYASKLLDYSDEIYRTRLTSRGTQYQFDAVKKHVDNAYQNNPSDPNVLRQKGIIYFIFQDFEEANRLLALANSPEFKKLLPILDDLAAAEDEGTRSTVDLTVEALRELPKEHEDLAHYLFLNATARTPAGASSEERPRLVEAMIGRANPGIEDFKLNWTRSSDHKRIIVDLSSYPDLETIHFETPPYDHCMFYRLNPVSIDLSGTRVLTIASLRDLGWLRSLNVAGAPIEDLASVIEIPDLRRLIVDKNQQHKLMTLELPETLIVEVQDNRKRR